MHLTKSGIIVFLALLLSAPGFASAQSVPELAQKALAATVSLEMQDEKGNTLGQGSGFFVRRNLIATNFHVIDGAAKGYVKLVNTATTYPIEGFTAANEANDLALLKVSVHGINPLDLGNSDAVQIGETVYVAGNPLGFEGTFSDGIISGRRDSAGKKERLQMTAPISPGSSGGPVLNRKGEVIGVSTSLYNPLFGQNLNFAVPSKALQALLAQSGLPKPLPYRAAASYFTYLLRGQERNLSGDFEGALREFTHAIRLDPDDAVGYFLRGITKAELRRYPAAILDYDEAIRLDPNEASAYHNRGYAKAQLGQHSAAILDYNAAIRLDSTDVLAYVNRGHAKAQLGQHSAAILDYNAAIRLDPNEALAYYNRGHAKAQLGQHSAAILDYDAAIRLDPNDASAYVNRGYDKAQLGQHSAVILDYDEAIRLDPNEASAYHNRGYDKAQLSQHSAAILDYDEAIRLDPNDALFYHYRGIAKRKLHQDSSAIRDFKTASRLATLTDNQNLKARIEKELRQLDQ